MNAIPGGQPSKTRPTRSLRRRSFRRASRALVAAVQMLTLCSFASRASADEVDWKGNHSTDWFDDKNWKPSDVPDNRTDAIIDDISHNITVINRSNATVVHLIVGDSSTGVLNIQGAGTLTADSVTLGNATASLGTVTVTGANANLTVSGALIVGDNGIGCITVSNGTLNAASITLGNATLSFGTLTLTGDSAHLTDSGALFVGVNGIGRLTVSNGSLANVNGVLMGQGSRFNANITVDDAHFINLGGLTIGDSSNATFNILAGSDVTAFLVTTAQTVDAQALLTLTGTNAKLTVDRTLVIASAGTSTLSLSGGATLLAQGTGSPDTVVFGQLASANATVTITGLNTGLLSAGNVVVGKAGNATLTLSAGGLLSTASLSLASQAGSTGTINIGAAPGSSPVAPGSLSAASVFMGNGTATINFNHTSNALPFSPAITGNGTINVLAGTTVFLGNSTYSGSTIISPGATLQLGGAAGNTNSGAIISGITNNGNLISNRTNAFTLPGIIVGTGNFQQLGSGTTILTANNTYTGLTTISAGTLQIGNVNTRATPGTGAVIDNSVLAVNRIRYLQPDRQSYFRHRPIHADRSPGSPLSPRTTLLPATPPSSPAPSSSASTALPAPSPAISSTTASSPSSTPTLSHSPTSSPTPSPELASFNNSAPAPPSSPPTTPSPASPPSPPAPSRSETVQPPALCSATSPTTPPSRSAAATPSRFPASSPAPAFSISSAPALQS